MPLIKYTAHISPEDYANYQLRDLYNDYTWVRDFENKYLTEADVCGYGVYGVKIGLVPNTIDYEEGDSCD